MSLREILIGRDGSEVGDDPGAEAGPVSTLLQEKNGETEANGSA